jgi:hypothetical protein
VYARKVSETQPAPRRLAGEAFLAPVRHAEQIGGHPTCGGARRVSSSGAIRSPRAGASRGSGSGSYQSAGTHPEVAAFGMGATAFNSPELASSRAL